MILNLGYTDISTENSKSHNEQMEKCCWHSLGLKKQILLKVKPKYSTLRLDIHGRPLQQRMLLFMIQRVTVDENASTNTTIANVNWA